MTYRFQKKRALISAFVDPVWITDLKLELDVSNFNSLTFNVGKVSQINDISGGGNHFRQTSSGNQIPYQTNQQNGLPSLFFDGALAFLTSINNFVTNAEDTWFFVFQTDLDGDINGTLFGDYGSSSNKLLLIRSDGAGAQPGFFARDGNADVLLSTPTYNTSYNLWVLTRKTGEITSDYNDVKDIQSGTYTATTYDGGNIPMIGSQPHPTTGRLGSSVFKGHFSAMRRYDRVLTLGEITQVKAFYKNKWAL